MGLARAEAIVIGGFPLGESDRVVTFWSREFGKVRGVARAARRMRSRFGAALELFTLGHLVFFDSGRSELVQVDHFDIISPFDKVRDRLDALGEMAWMVECVARLTAERDPNPAVYGVLRRALRSVEAGIPPRRVAVVAGVRCIDALGHRLRIDACVVCGRRTGLDGGVAIDEGGAVCAPCARSTDGVVTVASSTLASLARLRGMAWGEATARSLGRAEGELRDLLDLQVTRLVGQPVRTSRFIRELDRFSPTPGGAR